MSLTKLDIAQHLTQVLGLTKERAKAIVEQFFSDIADSLERGESVNLSGFGKFELHDKKERLGRNVKTGEPVPIKARRVVRFRPSKKIKSRLRPPPEAHHDESS